MADVYDDEAEKLLPCIYVVMGVERETCIARNLIPSEQCRECQHHPAVAARLRNDGAIMRIAKAELATLEREYQADCERYQAQLAERGRETERLEKSLGEAVDSRDHFENVIEHLADEAGCTQEWSSEHEHGVCVTDALSSARVEIADLRAELAKWLKWSGGQYPYDGGTIVLDKSLTTWNPLRAVEYLSIKEEWLRAKSKSQDKEITDLRGKADAEKRNSEPLAIPYHWPKHYNANTSPCDIVNGPCACGSWHKVTESWVAALIKKYGWNPAAIEKPKP